VIQDGSAFVSKRSKDLLIASYVAWALYERDGLDGLATGLAMLTGLLERYEGIFPARPRARGNALAWLLARFDLEMAQEQPPRGAWDRETLARLQLAAKAFAATARDKLGDDAPGLRPLLEQIARLEMSLPAPAPPPPPPAQPSPAQPSPAQPSPAQPSPAQPSPAQPSPAPRPAAAPMPSAPTLAAGADVTLFLQQSGNALVAAAKTLRAASAADPVAYRLLRTGLYLASAAAPPISTPPKTNVPAPPEKLRQQLQTLSNNAKWAALLDEAESALSTARFWLDLHRYVHAALVGLGHGPAAEAVEIEVAHLVRRLPELLERQFADGTPFAGGDTADWLRSIAGAPGGEGGGGGTAADPVDELVAEAKKLAGSGKRSEALEALQAAARTAADDRARFRLRLALARLCAQGSTPVARGLLEGLTRDVDTMRLDLWEPALAAEALRAHYELLREGAKTNPRVAEEAADVYRRLCRVDALAAIAVGS
jgi:type VI secretion system protein VasJ